MNGWSDHVRRIAVAVLGLTAAATVAVAVPASASAKPVAGGKSVTVVSTTGTTSPKGATHHSNSWDW